MWNVRTENCLEAYPRRKTMCWKAKKEMVRRFKLSEEKYLGIGTPGN
jgi:hypothetical protein